ncbi:response regulator [Pedobacter sp. KACC 23697]|uniref:Response regulator n=1 Tax=Pedobacter sp. KACC 23697 TaxID=3149230 RepID=A0AAU7K0Y3_9SPHI
MDKKKIMICDDDEGIIDVLEMILDEVGHKVISVNDSLKVQTAIDREQPDLLILDLWMPRLSGQEVLRILRNHSAHEKLKVIVISASRDGEQIAKDAGANLFIAKPFDLNNILDSVNALLN